MAYVPYVTMSQLTDQYPTVRDFIPTASDNYRWILASCTQMDLNHHPIGFALNYVCIQWVEILPQPNRRKKLCVFSWFYHSQHDVCHPNDNPLGKPFGDTWAYPSVSWLWRKV